MIRAILDPTPRRAEAVSQLLVFSRVSPAQAEYVPKVEQEGVVKRGWRVRVVLPLCSLRGRVGPVCLYRKLIEATKMCVYASRSRAHPFLVCVKGLVTRRCFWRVRARVSRRMLEVRALFGGCPSKLSRCPVRVCVGGSV